MANILIYRPPSTLVATVSVDEKTVLSKKLMNEHKITSEFISKTILDIQLGDYISYGTENFFINRLPDIVKLNNSTFKYNITFESVLYDLYRKLFISSDGLADFSYSGEAVDFLTNIVASINEISPGWIVGIVDATEELLLQFTNESCRSALTRVAEAFKLEFGLVGKVINMISAVGYQIDRSFQYGRNKGLYKLTRQQVSDQNIVTRVYGFGGMKNIPFGYRTRAKRLVFETGMPAVRYLEKNVNLYGVIEGQFTDDNIYPQRTGELTGVNMVFDAGTGTDYNPRTSYVEDTDILFDLNDSLIEGVVATIVFKSGDLAGQEFEIWKYVHATGRIYFNPYSDTDGYTTPNTLNVPIVGDTYTLINISLPQDYIDTAEVDLKEATQTFLDQNCIPQVVYSLDIDPHYAKISSTVLDAGDKVTIVDTDLGINSPIRIAGIEFPLINPFKIKVIISDFVPYTIQERIIKKTIENVKETIYSEKRSVELTRKNIMHQNQLNKIITVPMYQGIYDNGKTYYGNLARFDIVKYDIPGDDPDLGEIYFMVRTDAPAESFSGIVPTNTDYWKRFDAQYSSIATDLLFAELAYIENLGVKYFAGVPVGSGTFRGAVKIEGNHIWEDTQDSDTLGYIMINYKGYNGGTTRNRTTIIGDGKGNTILLIGGGEMNVVTTALRFTNIPAGSAGLTTGRVYRDSDNPNATLKIV